MSNKLRTNFVARKMAWKGGFSSTNFNAMIEELAVDLANVATRWNTEAYPILNSLPRGSSETRWDEYGATNIPDPVTDGLHGDSMFADNDATSATDDGLFWDITNNRPATIRETFLTVDDRLDTLQAGLESQIAGVASGLTDAQWTRLGIRVKDPLLTSADSSADGMASWAKTRVGYMADDIYAGSPGSVPGTRLTYSIEEMVDALLELHNGDWSDDITLDHSGLTGLTQQDIDNSSTYNQLDRSPGTATDLEEDLRRIRYEIARTRFGTSTDESNTQWRTDATDPVGGDGSLTTHMAYKGDGVQDSENCHGVARQNVDGLDTELGYTHTFIGKSGMGNEMPTYSSTNTVSNGDSLETAIGKLDAAPGHRQEYAFSDHDDEDTPITVSHNSGVTYPVVQVVDTYVADYISGGEIGVAYGDRYAVVDYLDSNSFNVYTNIIDGIVLWIS